eukprot:366445-Chlamydomonas_euryale.AAC.5
MRPGVAGKGCPAYQVLDCQMRANQGSIYRLSFACGAACFARLGAVRRCQCGKPSDQLRCAVKCGRLAAPHTSAAQQSPCRQLGLPLTIASACSAVEPAAPDTMLRTLPLSAAATPRCGCGIGALVRGRGALLARRL